MKDIEAALVAWRVAERRIEETDGNATPEMHQELSVAKSRYQEIATAHMTEWIDALHDGSGVEQQPSLRRIRSTRRPPRRRRSPVRSGPNRIKWTT